MRRVASDWRDPRAASVRAMQHFADTEERDARLTQYGRRTVSNLATINGPSRSNRSQGREVRASARASEGALKPAMPLFSQPFGAGPDGLLGRRLAAHDPDLGKLLRERGNQYLEHAQSGKPPVLVFDYEMVVTAAPSSARRTTALVRIKPPADCLPIDSKKRPFVVIRPACGTRTRDRWVQDRQRDRPSR